ncbi:MAG: hypothetical protein RI563_05735 [Thiohalophilus sp.]|uniref:hypothetical protein n=1 Tax=Thiohalophilus sp. TaxID=3028392 RepID=UPI00287085B8|nr:hypothetical protein [Thiohalophilus sp.]MDR9436358.1 hypothetical protein [Thiohalophilus sp.]
MDEAPVGLRELRQQLAQQGRRYLALSPIDQPRARIRFPGQFEGREIIWDADLRTLHHEYEQARAENPATTDAFRQYIHIHPAQGECVPIVVALNVPQFDEPAILKTLIMIHNYKRLRLGRHEFGPPVYFSD